MRTRLLAVAAATALASLVPLPADAASDAAAGLPYNVCTSLVSPCLGGCNVEDVVTVTVYGHGYGRASCGTAAPDCHSPSQLSSCRRSIMTFSGSSYLYCLADPYGSEVAVAVCNAAPPVD